MVSQGEQAILEIRKHDLNPNYMLIQLRGLLREQAFWDLITRSQIQDHGIKHALETERSDCTATEKQMQVGSRPWQRPLLPTRYVILELLERSTPCLASLAGRVGTLILISLLINIELLRILLYKKLLKFITRYIHIKFDKFPILLGREVSWLNDSTK